MRKIINTSTEEAKPEWTMGGNPNAILQQEARGQEQLINSGDLPIKCSAEDKKKLEKLGVVFGEPLPDDPLFCKATLPEGWGKQATEHSMWSKLVDENGVVRANIFYKAAFYDRRAHMDAS